MIRKETVHIIWVTIQAGLVMLLLGACSTTKHLPEGEILYTGSKTIVENEPQAPLTEDALTELDAALDKAPSTKILGFVPIPFKMWAYNSLVRYKKVSDTGSSTGLPPILPCSFLRSIRKYVPK